jgi:hypothetical protein
MDPLSVAASVAGLLSLAGSLSGKLSTFVRRVRDAPDELKIILTELNGLKTVLGELQLYILGNTLVHPARRHLILVEQVLTTLTGCVTTCSDLEVELKDIDLDGNDLSIDRAKWALKERSVGIVMQRLNSYKTSLILMLNIVQW